MHPLIIQSFSFIAKIKTNKFHNVSLPPWRLTLNMRRKFNLIILQPVIFLSEHKFIKQAETKVLRVFFRSEILVSRKKVH